MCFSGVWLSTVVTSAHTAACVTAVAVSRVLVPASLRSAETRANVTWSAKMGARRMKGGKL